jgi:DedD protein
MLRQRLVGALVLTALGVVFWPIIFVDQSLQTPAERLQVPSVETYEPLTPVDESEFQWPAIEVDASRNPQADSDEPDVAEDAARTAELLSGDTALPAAAITNKDLTEPPEDIELDDKGRPIAYTLQVVSMARKSDARSVSLKLQELGYKAYVVEVDRPEGIRYRVYVGPKYQKRDLAPVKAAVDKALSVKSLIVRYWP